MTPDLPTELPDESGGGALDDAVVIEPSFTNKPRRRRLYLAWVSDFDYDKPEFQPGSYGFYSIVEVP